MSLQDTSAACRLQFSWWGVSKAVTKEQKQHAAEAFSAEQRFLSMSKKLIDTKNEAWKALNSVKAEAVAYWKDHSLPYVEDGIRLIARHKVEEFNNTMDEFQRQLRNAAENFANNFAQIRDEARDRLSDLFNIADYPPDIENMFQMAWDFPSTNPPDYLRELNPQLYEQERLRIAKRFEDAATLAQQAFAQELHELVARLADRLGEDDDGEKKTFRNSAVVKLTDFFTRFRELTSMITTNRNQDLDDLVVQAQLLMNGVTPDALREDDDIRDEVRSGFEAISSRLDEMIVAAPRRRWEPETALETA